MTAASTSCLTAAEVSVIGSGFVVQQLAGTL